MLLRSSTRTDFDGIVGASRRLRGVELAAYLPVALIAGAVIALQICVMRIFSVGNWAHVGSLVISVAMLAFGLTSAVMCIARRLFERWSRRVAAVSLLAFGPFAVLSNLLAQQTGFNAVFLVSDSTQKWRLAAEFMLYLMPFMAGATFLGVSFLQGAKQFNRLYFADLVGSGIGGLLILGAMFWIAPDQLMLAPMALWVAAGVAWVMQRGTDRGFAGALALATVLSFGAQLLAPGWFGWPTLSTTEYKGVAYARKFPDSRRVYAAASPFGFLEVYASSYLHFAPGQSDNAAFRLARMPDNAYLGLYVDGEGPQGIIRNLPDDQTAYFSYLPMVYPYLLKKQADTFVVQYGGGLSTAVALREGARQVTVSESNPAVLTAFRNPVLSSLTGDLLGKVEVVDREGRLFLAATDRRFDVVDLSLADSAGLSSPGGFAIVEKFAYAREAMASYMRALKSDGILSVTLWNKEEPPASVLKLYATMAEAARLETPDVSRCFIVVSSYLSTATVLFKRDGFSDGEIATLRAHTKDMAFLEIYYPGMVTDPSQTDRVLTSYREAIFPDGAAASDGDADPTAPGDATGEQQADDAAGGVPSELPSVTLERIFWRDLLTGSEDVARRYVFDTRALTNDRPYFAAYVKTADLPRAWGRLEILQGEWGYLLLWATLGVAMAAAAILILLPLVFGWRTVFAGTPGKTLTALYFACLGLGYITAEVGLISHFVLVLSNATISASVLITGMLMFSGLGSLVSERLLGHARAAMPFVLCLIAALLIGYGYWLDAGLSGIGGLRYGVRLLLCFAVTAPPAFLMGFPMPTAMNTLGRLGKTDMFLWAWCANGCFSVLGAAAVPLIATSFGTGAVLFVSGAAYLVAMPAFYAIVTPARYSRTLVEARA